MSTGFKILAALVLAVLAVLAFNWFKTSTFNDGKKQGLTEGRAEVTAKWNEERAANQAATIEEGRRNAAETLRRMEAHERNQREQNRRIAAARRDAAGAAAAVDSLRLRASAYLDAAGCSGTSGDSAVECIRKAASQIADALGMCAARHQQLAFATDEARERGLKCEADYDGLSLKP